MIEQRAGGAYDPHLAALATDHLDELLDGLDDALIWEQAIAAEPPPQRWMSGEEIDAAFRVVGTFTDLKSYWLRGHAEGTSELAEAAAWRLGAPEDEVIMVRHAALALDLGRVAVSNAIWEKPGPFGLTDWERVQLHPYFTERSFAHAPALASTGELAGAHHERLDGAGYHRKALAPALGRAARILAAADSYQAMRERRPHRPALDADGAEVELLRDAREGRLCPEAVDAVLAAAGHRVAKRPRELPAGLTDRELEVLLALAAGKTNKEIAETLGISPKTAGHHVQHIFDKTGARTRIRGHGLGVRTPSRTVRLGSSRVRLCRRGGVVRLCRCRVFRLRGRSGPRRARVPGAAGGVADRALSGSARRSGSAQSSRRVVAGGRARHVRRR